VKQPHAKVGPNKAQHYHKKYLEETLLMIGEEQHPRLVDGWPKFYHQVNTCRKLFLHLQI